MRLFDSHFHIIDQRFPLRPNNGYLPEEFTCQHYRIRTEPLNTVDDAVVSGSFQGFNQTYLRAALTELGPTFVGVTQLPAATSDREIMRIRGTLSNANAEKVLYHNAMTFHRLPDIN